MFVVINANAQFQPGFSTSNYNGVLGVYGNPANALGKSSWDVHLFGLDVMTANKNGKIRLSDIGEEDYLRTKLIGDDGYNDASLRVSVPALSFLIAFGTKSSLAVTSRARIFMNATDVDAKFINALAGTDDGKTNYPYSFTQNVPSIVNATGTAEYGVTWANEIFNTGPHYLKAGATAKYISGVGNINVQTKLAGSIKNDNGDNYISPGIGTVGLRVGGSAFIDDFNISELYTFNGGGVGFDLGISYEFRPKNWNVPASGKGSGAKGRVPYLFKVDASLVDIGKIKYQPDPEKSKEYDVHIPATDQFYFTEFDEYQIGETSQVLDNFPEYFTRTAQATNNYKVRLPTTLQLSVDYNIGRSFFVNAEAQIGFNANSDWNSIKTFNYYAITPRYDTKGLGFFLPISYHQMTGFNVGAAVHLGPLYVGSGSILSLLGGGSKQADVYFGLRFGGIKKSKAPKSKKEKLP